MCVCVCVNARFVCVCVYTHVQRPHTSNPTAKIKNWVSREAVLESWQALRDSLSHEAAQHFKDLEDAALRAPSLCLWA